MNKVTKRKDGRYQCVIELPSLDGKRRRKYVYASSSQECRRLAYEMLQDIETGCIEDKKVTVSEYLKKWIEIYCKNLSPTSIDSYSRYIKRYIAPNIGNYKLAKLLPIHVQELVNEFAKDHSSKSCQCLVGILRKACNDAICDNVIKKNPTTGIRMPKGKKYEYNIYTSEQYNHLLSCVSGSIEELPIILAGLCGMRKSEILGLTWNDVDFEKNQIKIRQSAVNVNGNVYLKEPKTETSVREITAPQYAMDVLSTYKSVGFVYPGKNGKPENGANYGKRFQTILKKHGLPHTRFHDLRHFNATLMLTLGIPDKEAASRLGHSDTNMTKKYQHVLKSRDQIAADAINSIISNGCQNGCQNTQESHK